MAGGTAESFAAALPIFEAMGKKIVHCGPVGAGQATKLVNQVVGAVNLEAAAEGILFALRSGLDLEKTLDAVGGGAAASWAWANLAPRMAASDYAPGFKIAHQMKDLRLALEAAAELGIELPGTRMVLQHLERVAAESPENIEKGTQAVITALGRTA
jgi:3-hydroxyisobutyrate dehydrogenase